MLRWTPPARSRCSSSSRSSASCSIRRCASSNAATCSGPAKPCAPSEAEGRTQNLSHPHRGVLLVMKKDDPAFLYFPTNYRWSMGCLICQSGAPCMGAEIDEPKGVGRALLDRVGDDEAWFAEWKRMGDKVEARGREAEQAGHNRTAASCYMRASRYYQTGERFKQPRTQESMDTYAKSVRCFADAAKLLHRPRIEPVEVPYGKTSLPALLVHPDPEAAGSKPAPCVVFFDGFDVTKELQYGYGVPDLAARGIGCLIVD